MALNLTYISETLQKRNLNQLLMIIIMLETTTAATIIIIIMETMEVIVIMDLVDINREHVIY